MSNNTTIFSRNQYGEIINPNHGFYLGLDKYTPQGSQYAKDLYAETCHLIKLAVNRKKIPAAYDSITWDKKRRADGYATHHGIYDISADARHLLLCVRETEGTRYGVKTTAKNYYIISTHGQGVRVVEAPKAKAAKAAKQAINPGDAIAVCQGKKKLQATPGATCAEVCYKIVAQQADTFISVYDDSPWPIGKARRQRATADHSGGFYVFTTISDALTAWEERIAFADEWLHHDHYALLACECTGRYYLHDNKKMCITNVKPIEVIAGLIA